MMHLSMKKEDKNQLLEISGSLTVAWCAHLKKELQKSLKKGQNLQLEIKNVAEVDLSFIQVLCAAIKTFRNENKELVVKLPVPDLVAENIRLAGLNNHGSCQAGDCLWCDVQNQGSGE